MPTAVKMPCHASVIGPRWTFGSSPISIASPSVALLELLPRPAPARIVAAELRVGRRGGGDRAPSVAAHGRERALRLRLALLDPGLLLLFALRLLRGLHRHAQDRLGHAARDPAGHLPEERVRLALVRDERILLAIAAEVDALAQLLHGGEVLDPVRVDGPQEDPALDDARELLAELGLAALVGLVDERGHLLA